MFDTHFNSKKHEEALKKQLEVKRILSKRADVYSVMLHGGKVQKVRRVERNRNVIKKFFKTVYFAVKKTLGCARKF